MADPFLKFFTADWRSDPRLRMCSAAARGLWIEMICLMHEAAPYGHLRVHGQPPNEAQLASLTGIREAELPDLIAELERHGVFSRTREGVIYSRKLVRMAAKSAKARKNGVLGGNPSIGKDRGISGSVNLEDNPQVKPHIPEARYQKEKEREPDGSPKKPRSRATRLPENWSLPDEWRQESIGKGASAALIDREAERFRNYWIAKAGPTASKLDWRATWRNWIIDKVPPTRPAQAAVESNWWLGDRGAH